MARSKFPCLWASTPACMCRAPSGETLCKASQKNMTACITSAPVPESQETDRRVRPSTSDGRQKATIHRQWRFRNRPSQTRFATTAGSYLSANDKRLHFGLGDTEIATVDVSWPSGDHQMLKDVRADQFLEIREQEHS